MLSLMEDGKTRDGGQKKGDWRQEGIGSWVMEDGRSKQQNTLLSF